MEKIWSFAAKDSSSSIFSTALAFLLFFFILVQCFICVIFFHMLHSDVTHSHWWALIWRFKETLVLHVTRLVAFRVSWQHFNRHLSGTAERKRHYCHLLCMLPLLPLSSISYRVGSEYPCYWLYVIWLYSEDKMWWLILLTGDLSMRVYLRIVPLDHYCL